MKCSIGYVIIVFFLVFVFGFIVLVKDCGVLGKFVFVGYYFIVVMYGVGMFKLFNDKFFKLILYSFFDIFLVCCEYGWGY